MRTLKTTTEVLKLVSNKPSSIRYDDDVRDFLDGLSDAIDKSNLPIGYNRSDLVHMMVRDFKKSNNKIFLMLLDNLEDADEIDTFTVRGVVRAATKTDLKESEFKAAISALV